MKNIMRISDIVEPGFYQGLDKDIIFDVFLDESDENKELLIDLFMFSEVDENDRRVYSYAESISSDSDDIIIKKFDEYSFEWVNGDLVEAKATFKEKLNLIRALCEKSKTTLAKDIIKIIEEG